jgi:hypothetical protein
MHCPACGGISDGLPPQSSAVGVISLSARKGDSMPCGIHIDPQGLASSKDVERNSFGDQLGAVRAPA